MQALPEQQQLAELVSEILEHAAGLGASAAETAVSASSALSVSVRLGEVETLEHHRSRGLAVTVYLGQRKGSASSSDWSREALRETVAAACAIAKHTAEDACAGLAEPERLARDIPDLDLYHPWALSAEQAIDLAQRCEASALQRDPRLSNSEGASVASRSGCSFYANSHGFAAGYPSTRHSLSCSLIASQDGAMQRGHWFSIARDAEDLEAAAAVGECAADRALARLGARRIGTCTVPVLFIPEMARGLIGHFTSAVSGGALYRKASFLLDRLGEQVFPKHFNIRERPHLAKALASAPFDGEGVATRARDLVSEGVLQGYVLDSYSARRLGMETTGNAGGIHNLIVEPGGQDFDELLQTLQRGLVVTGLMGQGVNLLTGDYSRGANGFWVENGVIQHPVEEITIAGNLRDMLAAIIEVGRDVDRRSAIHCGSLLIESMTVAGA